MGYDANFDKLIDYLVGVEELTRGGVQAIKSDLEQGGSNVVLRLLEMTIPSVRVAEGVSMAFNIPLYPTGQTYVPGTPNQFIQMPIVEYGEGWLITDEHYLYAVDPFDMPNMKRIISDLKRNDMKPKKIGVIARAHYNEAAGVKADEEKASASAGAPHEENEQYKQMIDEIIINAVRRNASDIHFEPTANHTRVRLRIDSNMVDMPILSHSEYKNVANIILSQTGKGKAGTYIQALDDMFVFEVPPSRRVKLRVMMVPVTLPGLQEELPCFCLRILGNVVEQISLRDLGIPSTQKNPQLTQLQMVCERKNGLVLVSGPTGSGKTTTLQAVFANLQRVHPNRCRYTAEDPVEMNLTGVNHVQVNEDAGLTFARCVKSFLRGDPDDILIGEIRDLEVASQALTGSITGHLVFSTIHTNSAVECVTRLIDLGCDAFLVAAALKAATAQRLVRKVCKHCSTLVPWEDLTTGQAPYLQSAENELKRIRYMGAFKRYGDLDDYPSKPGTTVYVAGEGCAHCTNGYSGRMLITEFLDITPVLSDLISRRSSVLQLKQQAQSEGFKEMWQHAATEIFVRKTTTFDEIIDSVGERDLVA